MTGRAMRWLVAGLVSLVVGAAGGAAVAWLCLTLLRHTGLSEDGRWGVAVPVGIALGTAFGAWLLVLMKPWFSAADPVPDTVQWPVVTPQSPPRVTDCFQTRPEQALLRKALEGNFFTRVFRRAKPVVVAPVLTGMGGVGKTQLAARYAQTQLDEERIDLLVWVSADEQPTIISDYAKAADAIGITAPGDQDDGVKADKFRSWLAGTRNKKWLVVLDDVVDLDGVDRLKPPVNKRGKTIVTTRQLGSLPRSGNWKRLKINPFTDNQAHQYLRDRLVGHQEALAGARELAQALGHLPLALDFAASYILETMEDGNSQLGARTCAEYLGLFNARLSDLREPDHNDPLVRSHMRTVTQIWSMSIDRVEEQHPASIARPLMEVLSLLSPLGIPFPLVNTPAVHRYLGSRSPNDIRNALAMLRRFSLLIDSGDDKGRPIVVHVLVQQAVRATAEPGRLADAARALAEAMLPDPPARPGDDVSLGLPEVPLPALQENVLALYRAIREPLRSPEFRRLLILLGDSYGEKGLLTQAHEFFAKLRERAAAALGEKDRYTLKTREREYYWLGFTGGTKDALREFEALVADETRVLGPEDLDAFIARHNVARFRGRDGDPESAVSDLEQVVADETRVLGPTHLQTLKSRNILGYWLSKAGDAEGGAAELEDVLPVLTEHYGSDHAETLRARIDLAMAKTSLGDYAGAIAAGELLIEDRTRVLGPNNPATLSARAYVAHWRALNGEDSVAPLQAIVRDHEEALPVRHPNTLRAQAYCIQALATSGKRKQAITEMTKHLKIVREALGKTHILTKECEHKLGEWQNGTT